MNTVIQICWGILLVIAAAQIFLIPWLIGKPSKPTTAGSYLMGLAVAICILVLYANWMGWLK